MATQPYVLVAGTRSHITTVRELIAAASADPGELLFGSTGVGTGTHVGVEKFNRAAGIRAVHVPPRPNEGNAEVTARVAAGELTYLMAPISFVLPKIRAGELVALSVTTRRRSVQLPEVPTIAESGVSGYHHPIW